jgi:ACS family hexuronate transporter-like MFS transporter
MLHAAARGLGSLCLFRSLLGLGEGGYYPTAMRGAAEWFPPQQRAKAVGLFLCGLCVGITLTPPLVLWITARHGWQAAFLVTGAMGFLLIPPWLLLHWRVKRLYGTADPAPCYLPPDDSAPEADEDLSVSEVLRQPKYWCLLMARALTDGAWWFYLFWIPGYFRGPRDLDSLYSPTVVGLILAIPFIAADMGSLGGAWASTALIQRGMGINRARKLLLFPSALLGALGALAHFVAEPAVAVLLVSLALFGHLSWASNIHTAISEIVPRRHLAVLYGTTGAVGTLMGALTQTLVGRAIDRDRYAEVFLCVGSAYLLAIVLLLCAGRIERLRRVPRAIEEKSPVGSCHPG